MDYIRRYRVNRRLKFLPQHEMSESLLFKLASSIPPCALFIVPPTTDRRLRMRDTTDEWARLTYSTSNLPHHEEIMMEAALWQASQFPNHSLLHEHHYWVYPIPPRHTKTRQLETTIEDISYQLWDTLYSTPQQTIIRPSHNANPSEPPGQSIDLVIPDKIPHTRKPVRVTRYANGIPVETRLLHETFPNLASTLINGTGPPPPCPSGPIPLDLPDSNVPLPAPDPRDLLESVTTSPSPLPLSPTTDLEYPATTKADTPADPSTFDSTAHLSEMLADLSADPLNTFTTTLPEGQIRVCSLNINGLNDSKLGFLLTYIQLKKLDVLALQDTRLTATESNYMGANIRRKYKKNVQVRHAPITVPRSSSRHKLLEASS